MDVQTVWVAVRALGVAAGLLVHAAVPQHAPVSAHATPLDAAIAAEHWRHMPHGMSMDQLFATLSR